MRCALRRTLRGSRQPPAKCWVIFDNTAAGLVVPNARRLQALLWIEQGVWV